MTSRTTVTSLLALFALSTIAAASCGGNGTSSSAPPPPKTTTTTSGEGPVTSAGGGDMTTTGTGGSGGIGGGGGSGGSGGASSCTDMLANGKETDKDCGGPTCDPCAANFGCKVDADCLSKNCDTSIHKCALETCTDGVINGKETDKDCGGGFCDGCGVGQFCMYGTDCKGGDCNGTTCEPTCNDDSISPSLNETDIDCGGATCPKCNTGFACKLDTDCMNKVCNKMLKKCDAAKCTDTIQNGSETDIDCGGGGCSKCEAAQKCQTGSDCRSNSCVNMKCACPPGMQPVPKKTGGGSYCIDTTEVTYAQYQVFYSANPDNLNLPAGCPGSGSYPPSGGEWPGQPGTKELLLPVSHVDWCDAVAYCLYSGKHLCGKVDGGSNVLADSTDASKSEWYNACSAQGASAYPYGAVYDNTKCDGVDFSVAATPAGTCGANTCGGKVGYDLSIPATLVCQGGAPNVWGMSGNLAEWEDSCDNANPPNCLVRGGSRCEKGAAISCAAGISQPRTYKGCDVGIRCCF
jgi:formylglycine-generating enzyme required for sulfatase activity